MGVPEARVTEEGVIFEVHVTPRARSESVTYANGVLKVKTTAAAQKGEANKAVLTALEPFFGGCEIIGGFKSHRKTIHARNMDYRAFVACLDALAEGKTR